MEPVTFLAIAAFVVHQASSTAVDRATADAYELLKDKLKGRLGDDSEVVDAVSRLEDKPESEPRQGVVREELDEAGADEDPEIEAAARKLLELMDGQPGASQHVQSIRGNYNAQAQDHSSASVSSNHPEVRQTE